ncbi:hypothetical protein NBRC116493_04590 [Aurantivibrio infirmus]
MTNILQRKLELLLFPALLLSSLLTGCVSTETLTAPAHINLSPENMTFTSSSDDRLDFGFDVSPNESDSLDNLEILPGVRVRSVKSNSVAELAGIRSGDVLLEMNAIKTNSPDVIATIAEAEPTADIFELLVQRGTTVFSTKMAKPKVLNRATPEERYRVDAIKTRAGYRSELIGSSNQVEPQKSVARIVEIFPDSPFLEKNIKKGDAIISINGTAITSAQSLVTQLSTEFDFGEKVTLEMLRGNESDMLTSERVTVTLWQPERKITGLGLWPLFNYKASVTPSSSKLTVFDLILFSLFSYERVEGEKIYRLFSIFEFSSGYGELVDESTSDARP